MGVCGASASNFAIQRGLPWPRKSYIDPIAVIADIILGDDPLKGTGSSINVVLGSLSWSYTIAAGTVEPTIDLGQAFNMNIGALSSALTDNGNPVAFNFSSPTTEHFSVG